METCLFCKIVEKAVPAETVYEDEKYFAFLDIRPVNKGHTLVIPKKHAVNIFDIPREEFKNLMGIVHMLAPKIQSAVGANGINIGMNNDHAAGQIVFHVHIHIIPRFTNDGFRHWHGQRYKEEEPEAIGNAIRKSLLS